MHSLVVQSLPGTIFDNLYIPNVSLSARGVFHFAGRCNGLWLRGREGGVCPGFSGVLSVFPQCRRWELLVEVLCLATYSIDKGTTEAVICLIVAVGFWESIKRCLQIEVGKCPYYFFHYCCLIHFQLFSTIIIISVSQRRKPKHKKFKITEQIAKLRFEFSWLQSLLS